MISLLKFAALRLKKTKSLVNTVAKKINKMASMQSQLAVTVMKNPMRFMRNRRVFASNSHHLTHREKKEVEVVGYLSFHRSWLLNPL